MTHIPTPTATSPCNPPKGTGLYKPNLHGNWVSQIPGYRCTGTGPGSGPTDPPHAGEIAPATTPKTTAGAR